MFCNFLTALEFQLLKAPEDWFKDELTEDNFLRKALVSLYENIQDLGLSQPGGGDARLKALVDRGGAFFKFIEARFGLKVRSQTRKMRGASQRGVASGDLEDGGGGGGGGGQHSLRHAGQGGTRVECDGEEMDECDEESSNAPMVVDLDAEGLGENLLDDALHGPSA